MRGGFSKTDPAFNRISNYDLAAEVNMSHPALFLSHLVLIKALGDYLSPVHPLLSVCVFNQWETQERFFTKRKN